jgi:ClpP class serine protease
LLVLVPEIALSAGTLIALGAHKIYMHPHAFLSPVDPTGNWKDIEGKTQSLAIEDVMGYVDFVSERVGIRDQAALVEALKELTKEVKAPRLGSIYRTRLLIERLSRNMLELHLDKIDDQPRITQIVDMLTHSLFTHGHMIAVKEAQKAIGLDNMVEEVKGQKERAMNRARKYINDTLELRATFDPEALLAKCPKPRSKPAAAVPDAQVKIEASRAIIHSRHARHTFKSTYNITKGTDGQVQVKPVGVTAWIREN